MRAKRPQEPNEGRNSAPSGNGLVVAVCIAGAEGLFAHPAASGTQRRWLVQELAAQVGVARVDVFVGIARPNTEGIAGTIAGGSVASSAATAAQAADDRHTGSAVKSENKVASVGRGRPEAERALDASIRSLEPVAVSRSYVDVEPGELSSSSAGSAAGRGPSAEEQLQEAGLRACVTLVREHEAKVRRRWVGEAGEGRSAGWWLGSREGGPKWEPWRGGDGEGICLELLSVCRLP